MSAHKMAWSTFVEHVEKHLAEQGASRDIEIEYIDFSWGMTFDVKEVGVFTHNDRLTVH